MPPYIPNCVWGFVPPPGCQYVVNMAYAVPTLPHSYTVDVFDFPYGPSRLRVTDGLAQALDGPAAGPKALPYMSVAPLFTPTVVNFTTQSQGA